MEKQTPTPIRDAIETTMDVLFCVESEKMQECTGMVENKLAKYMKQASIKHFLSQIFKRNMIDDRKSNIDENFFRSFFFLFFCSNGPILAKNRIRGDHFLRSRGGSTYQAYTHIFTINSSLRNYQNSLKQKLSVLPETKYFSNPRTGNKQFFEVDLIWSR